MAATNTTPTPTYRFQRVFAGLQTGHVLTVQQRREEPVRVFMQQSSGLDAACGLHMLSTALVTLNLAKASALHDMSRRKYGVAADVWAAFEHTYFTGVDAAEWVELVNGLHLPLRLTAKYGAADNADGYAVQWLMRGDLVALAFKSIKHHRTNHWALAVGIQGVMTNGKHQPDRILLLDPSAGEVSFSVYNAHLDIASSGAGNHRRALRATPPKSRPRKPLHWEYESLEWPTESVRLLAAVRFRLRA